MNTVTLAVIVLCDSYIVVSNLLYVLTVVWNKGRRIIESFYYIVGGAPLEGEYFSVL